MIALVFVSVAAFNSKAVMAAVARLFGFVPGVGIVDVENNGTSGTDLYILDDNGTVYKDDMLEITVMGAFADSEELELRYTVYLSRITNSDLESSYNDASGLYRRLGYDKFFDISEESPVLSPKSVTVLNGRELTAFKTVVTKTESLESMRTICIRQHYKLNDVDISEGASGTISLSGAEVEFCLKQIDLESSAQNASGGQIIENDGIKLLCVPTLRDDTLYIDYYACELGEYAATRGFRGSWYNTDTLTIDGDIIGDELDESCIFNSEGSAHIGIRLKYDLSSHAYANQAVISAYGIFAEKDYDGVGISLDGTPADNQIINEVVALDDIDIEVSEMFHRNYGETEGYEESKYGYLEFRYKAETNNVNRFFMDFNRLGINGETIADGYYITPYDEDYTSIILPLPIPYEDVRSIDFESVLFLLAEDEEIVIPLKSE